VSLVESSTPSALALEPVAGWRAKTRRGWLAVGLSPYPARSATPYRRATPHERIRLLERWDVTAGRDRAPLDQVGVDAPAPDLPGGRWASPTNRVTPVSVRSQQTGYYAV
jgi:hypothetical protein